MDRVRGTIVRDTEDGRAWCAKCGVLHLEDGACVDACQPTGPERAAWQSTFVGTDGEMGVRILLAPIAEGWRARVVTAPRSLWVVPRSSTAMKFLGETEEDARSAALVFVHETLTAGGFHDRGAARPKAPAGVWIERRGGDEDPDDPDAALRKLYRLSARWGPTLPDHPGWTANLSKSGVFLVTDEPPTPGTNIRIKLEIGACSMPLEGRVVWRRPLAENLERPQGMGIHLTRPPSLYRDFVGRLAP